MHYPELEEMDELYDLRSDSGEVHNVIGKAENVAVLQRLKAELQRLNEEMDNPFVN